MRHSSRPTNQCKGRSEPITENPPDALPRFSPLAPEDRARRLAELRTALAGAAPTFQARIDAFGAATPHLTARATPAARPGPLHPTRAQLRDGLGRPARGRGPSL